MLTGCECRMETRDRRVSVGGRDWDPDAVNLVEEVPTIKGREKGSPCCRRGRIPLGGGTNSVNHRGWEISYLRAFFVDIGVTVHLFLLAPVQVWGSRSGIMKFSQQVRTDRRCCPELPFRPP